MDAAPPEIRAVEIFLAVVAEQIPDVTADEGRCVIVGRLEAVDHRRRAREEMLDAFVGGGRLLLCPLALGDFAPGADDLARLSLRIADEALRIIDPAIG